MKRHGRDWVPGRRSSSDVRQTVPWVPGIVVQFDEVLNTRTGETLTRDDGRPLFWRWWAVSVTLPGRCEFCGRRIPAHWHGCPETS